MLTLYELKQELLEYIDSNYSTELSKIAPILARYIRIENGLEITGTFSTNDGTDEGRPLYVTTLRQPDKPAVHDGYGFVVIKGNTVEERDIYNVYLVDHNVMVGDLTFGQFLQVPNINSYMTGGVGVSTAGKAVIEIDITYNFRLQINEDWAMELRIWKTGEDYTSSSWETMPDGPLDSGALVDGPLSYGGKQIQSPITGEFIDLPKGTHLGFAVEDPSGYKWTIGAVQIRKFSGGIPLQIFEFFNNNMIQGPIQVNYFGHGEHIVSEAPVLTDVDVLLAKVEDPDADPALQVFDSWEKLGSVNTYGTIHRLRKATTLDSKYYSIGGKFYVGVTKDFENISGIDLNTASIKTDYIEITNAQNRPIIDRSAIDIWIDPINILTKSTAGESTAIYLDGSGITTITTDVTYPVFFVENVYNVAAPGVNLLETGEITVYNNLDGLMYSARDTMRLSHPDLPGGMQIKIDYWNCGSYGGILQDFIEGSKYRGPAQDPLIRVVPATVLKITSMSYEGTQSVIEIQNEIIRFIKALGSTGTLRKSDFLSNLYGFGISKIILSTLEIKIIVYDYLEGWYSEFVLIDEYERPDTPGRWFTTTDYLNLTKL